MSVLKKEIRAQIIEQQQDGVSAYTQKPLTGKRTETHHFIERSEGGSNHLGNLRVVSIAEHLAWHFEMARNPQRSKREQEKDMDVVLGRLGELTVEEESEFYRVVEEKMGIRVRFQK